VHIGSLELQTSFLLLLLFLLVLL